MKPRKSDVDQTIEDQKRRAFMRRVGKLGLTAPATALLLGVVEKRAKAGTRGYGEPTIQYDGTDYDDHQDPLVYDPPAGGDSSGGSGDKGMVEYYDRGGVRVWTNKMSDQGGKGG